MWGTRYNHETKQSIPRFIPTHVGNTSTMSHLTPPGSVHPHACGEHRGELALKRKHIGSSPRMWGTHFLLRSGTGIVRFIPTHVGNTPAGPPAAVAAPVHPHACGEHNRDIRDPETGNGSSPRMWGTHFDILSHLLSLRFIPTHVGNTDVMRPNFL